MLRTIIRYMTHRSGEIIIGTAFIGLAAWLSWHGQSMAAIIFYSVATYYCFIH